jgi:saccharopine dehydrogenase-like NADP-dependent oxidoreductase
MKSILILGAGLSASSLIRYLLKRSAEYNWQVRVVDQDIELVKRKLDGHPNGVAMAFNALDPNERREEIAQADLVISMLPAKYHPEVARDCINLKKNLITPSYISQEMHELDHAAKTAGIVIMNEIGVDPGIDHMSAMQIIHSIEDKGGTLTSFRSFCGGLIAPESDNNPWNYKFTWNPRNVVLAGQGGAAKFIRNGEFKYIPYHQLFKRIDKIAIEGYGEFDGYANRDSLSYRSTYGIENIPTIYRGTLRRSGYCQAWDIFIELGMTDDSYVMENSFSLTARNYLNAFLPYDPQLTVEEKFKRFLGEERKDLFGRFEWLGLFDNETVVGSARSTPAQILEKILVSKWVLDPEDKDMLVMYHEFEYKLNGKGYKITSSMVNIGEDKTYTSMSNTVGLPAAIAAKMILTGTLKTKGVTLPIQREVYTPILEELAEHGISFIEKETTL